MKQLDEAAIVRGYQEGKSIRDLACEHGVSVNPIQRVLRKHDVQRRPTGVRGPDRGQRKRGAWRLELTDEQRQEIVRLFAAGDSQGSIGERFGISATSVGRELRKAGVAPGTHGQLREHHHAWKGGKTKTEDGYVMVRADPADEIATAMGPRNGYVLEHRLVMAHYLQRPLLRHETVHHLDLDHGNNDITNLQLRIGRHGRGAVYECEDCGSRRLAPVDL